MSLKYGEVITDSKFVYEVDRRGVKNLTFKVYKESDGQIKFEGYYVREPKQNWEEVN